MDQEVEDFIDDVAQRFTDYFGRSPDSTKLIISGESRAILYQNRDYIAAQLDGKFLGDSVYLAASEIGVNAINITAQRVRGI